MELQRRPAGCCPEVQPWQLELQLFFGNQPWQHRSLRHNRCLTARVSLAAWKLLLLTGIVEVLPRCWSRWLSRGQIPTALAGVDSPAGAVKAAVCACVPVAGSAGDVWKTFTGD